MAEPSILTTTSDVTSFIEALREELLSEIQKPANPVVFVGTEINKNAGATLVKKTYQIVLQTISED
jgi:hypothetical protein